jgi:hypothetical protein
MLVTHFAFWLGLLLVLAGFACVLITSGRAAKTKTLH